MDSDGRLFNNYNECLLHIVAENFDCENPQILKFKFYIDEDYLEGGYNWTRDSNGNVVVKVYDIQGNEVQKLVDEYLSAGYYSVNFDGSNLSSGVYTH